MAVGGTEGHEDLSNAYSSHFYEANLLVLYQSNGIFDGCRDILIRQLWVALPDILEIARREARCV